MNNTIKVLIIDDSRSVQKMLELFLHKYKELEIIGGAYDPYEAVKIMRNIKPDVIILDVKMPGMDGLTFLKKLMDQHPIPVIIHSSLITKNPEIGVKALEYGAIEVIDKPIIDFSNLTASIEHEDKLLQIVRQTGRTAAFKKKTSVIQTPVSKLTDTTYTGRSDFNQIICIGASAGGTQTIKFLIAQLPQDFPPILIVQHMPVEFTGQFANHLNHTSKLQVEEAKDRDMLLTGRVYIAPGDRHLTLKKVGTRYQIILDEGSNMSGHKPSVDMLFKSAAKVKGVDVVGVLLTGMGKDGAEGLLEMKNAGANTIAQDEASSIVFGMPKKAIELGAAQKVLSLEAIPAELMKMVLKDKGC